MPPKHPLYSNEEFMRPLLFMFLLITYGSICSAMEGPKGTTKGTEDHSSETTWQSMPKDVRLLILQESGDPIFLQKIKLTAPSFRADLEELFRRDQYRHIRPHHYWIKSGGNLLPISKRNLIRRYFDQLNGIAFSDRSDDDKMREIEELNKVFFYENGLVSTLKNSLHYAESNKLMFLKVFSIFGAWSVVLNKVSSNIVAYIEADVDAEIKEHVENYVKSNIGVNVHEKIWDFIDAQFNDDILQPMARMTLINQDIVLKRMMRDRVRAHEVEFNLGIDFDDNDLDFMVGIWDNIIQNMSRLLGASLESNNIDRDNLEESLYTSFRLPLLYGFSSYLFSNFVNLIDKKNDKTVTRLSLDLFNRFEFYPIEINSELFIPCNNYFEFHSASIGLDADSKYFIAAEIFDNPKLAENDYHHLVGVICNVLSDREEIIIQDDPLQRAYPNPQ